LKVLHLPYNVASQVSASVRGLRAIGVDAHGIIATNPEEVIQSHDEVEILPDVRVPRERVIRWTRQHAGRSARLLRAIAWADVLHWHFGRGVLWGGLDLHWARLLRKPLVAEFWGSDIRVAEIEARDNPHFAAHAPLEYRTRLTAQRSFEMQSRFSGARSACVVADAAMLSYVRRDLFPRVRMVRQRLLLSDFTPRPPDANRRRPLVVHSPSNPQLKGSAFVEEALERLRGKYEFEFRLVHGVARREALAILAEADIFVDQLILGTHGVAALEAMALAKPVVCYIKPSMIEQYSPALPIVSANPSNVADVLERLLASGQRRRDLGIRGRTYVEQNHDATRLAHQLRDIYQELLPRTSSGRLSAPEPAPGAQYLGDFAPESKGKPRQGER